MSQKPPKKSPKQPKKEPEPKLPEEAADDPQEPLLELGEPGSALFASISDDIALDEREIALLTLAGDQLDDLARLRDKIREEGIEGRCYKGQKKTSTHATEARNGRLAIARLLVMLTIPAEDEDFEKPMTEASRRAQHASRARWMKEADLLARRKKARQRKAGDG